VLVGGPKNVNRDSALVGMRERLLTQSLQNDRVTVLNLLEKFGPGSGSEF
jgi:hypothetical protein